MDLRDENRESRVPMEPSDWCGASEDAPEESTSWLAVSGAVDFRERGRVLVNSRE